MATLSEFIAGLGSAYRVRKQSQKRGSIKVSIVELERAESKRNPTDHFICYDVCLYDDELFLKWATIWATPCCSRYGQFECPRYFRNPKYQNPKQDLGSAYAQCGYILFPWEPQRSCGPRSIQKLPLVGVGRLRSRMSPRRSLRKYTPFLLCLTRVTNRTKEQNFRMVTVCSQNNGGSVKPLNCTCAKVIFPSSVFPDSPL